ncbi:HCLS1-binding protein 3 like protein [Argiope bruennichi]|uniref:HCLS1-binding protein 3 like protein n=1 Tax=Argiope bruennichi TaxID=94029 RepID=A0A8T0FY12_ARGBR|nr:HCLS1-binding protein 3 like protein [Argiope bruennichi]
MTTPSVTLRSIKNEDTGIDISVPRFKEEEAPLGGISVLYEIFVVTRLEIFKTRLHKSGDVVHFTIFKAYREIEDLYNKLNKRYPKAGLPPVPKASSKYTDDERVEALDLFFKAIAQNIEICHSSTFTHFIGINSHRLPSFTLPKTETTTDNCDKPNDVQNEEFDNSKKETVNEVEVFPKMKINAVEKVPSVQQPLKNVDLFEEVKHTKETTINTKSKGKFSQDLHLSFPDNCEFFFNRKNENLDDLLDLAPLPNSLLTSKKLEKEPEQSIEKELSPLPAKPVPLPRKKSLGKVEFESQPKPEVKPRKVFLNKANESTEEQRQKPELPVRPPVPAKPTTVQTKPAPPPKPKPPPKKPKPNVQTTRNTTNDLDAANANEPGNLNTATEDLKELDILKYIEQEEKSLDAQLNLFD